MSVLLFLQLTCITYAEEEPNGREDAETETESAPTKDIYELDKILIEGERVYSTASSRIIREFDLNVRPVSTAQDMLQFAPGLVIAQHAGGGKAEQIFIRGLMPTMAQMSPYHLMVFP